MESRGPEDSKNVKTSQAYFFEGFISFFEDFSLTTMVTVSYHYFIICTGIFAHLGFCVHEMKVVRLCSWKVMYRMHRGILREK